MKLYENFKKPKQKNKTRHPETSFCISHKQRCKQYRRDVFKESRLPDYVKLVANL